MSAVGKMNGTHRKSRTAEYHSWQAMNSRCYVSINNKFYLYGARGIIVCERWRNSFEAFLEDMGPKPSSEHSIDRWPNNDGNYEKSNCRWANRIEQRRNRRDFTAS